MPGRNYDSQGNYRALNRASDNGAWAIFWGVLISAIAIAALIIACIALSKFNQNPPPTKQQLNHPAGKMQFPTNYTHPESFDVTMQMQLNGFNLVFGNNVAIDANPGSYLIPQTHSGTYHFDFQVIALVAVEIGPTNITALTRNIQSWLTVDGVIYKNAGWGQDESVSHMTTVHRPDK